MQSFFSFVSAKVAAFRKGNKDDYTTSELYANKAVYLWTNEECLGWIESLKTVPNDIKDALFMDVAENKTNGDVILDICADARSVSAQILNVLPNVKATDCRTVCDALTAFQTTLRQSGNVWNNIPDNPTVEQENNDESFFTVLVAHGTKNIEIHNMRSLSTVADLKAAVADIEGIENFSLECKIELNENVMCCILHKCTSVSDRMLSVCD